MTYIPDHDSVLFPSDPDLEVGAESDVIIEKFQQGITLLFLVSNNRASD